MGIGITCRKTFYSIDYQALQKSKVALSLYFIRLTSYLIGYMSVLKEHIGKMLLILTICLLGYLGYKVVVFSVAGLKSSHKVQSSSIIFEPVQQEKTFNQEDIENIVKDYVISHPEVIVQSLEMLQQNKIKEQNEKIALKIQARKTELQDSEIFPSSGNEKADVTIVAFLDYNCGYCKKANDSINQLLQDDKGVKVIYILHPILGDGSEYMAKIALAIHKIAPDKFQMVHDRFMRDKISNKEDVAKILQENQIKIEDVEKELAQNEVQKIFAKSESLAQYIGISGVPAIIVEDKFFPGFLDLGKLKTVVEEIRAKK
jgi:protein-disulfide isomerase